MIGRPPKKACLCTHRRARTHAHTHCASPALVLSGASVCRLLAASTTRWSSQTWYYHVCLTFSRFSKNVPQVFVVVFVCFVLFLKKGAKDALTVSTNSPDVRKVWHLLFWKVCWNTLDIWIWKSALCDVRVAPNIAPRLVKTTPAIFQGCETKKKFQCMSFTLLWPTYLLCVC